MKKSIFYLISTILIATIAAFTYQNQKSIKKSDIAWENIEALTDSEVSEICGGCSTSYDGSYCCIIEIAGIPFTLYHPRTK